MLLISRRSLLQTLAAQLLTVNAASEQTRVHRKPKPLPMGAVTHDWRAFQAARGESHDGIRPAIHPRGLRCSSFKYGPIFSVVAPRPRGASSPSVLAVTFTTGC